MQPRALLANCAALASCALLLAGCGDREGPLTAAGGGFVALAEKARGQTVDWWMYGGDARVNAYVDEHVIPAARKAGVKLRRVPVTDTADAVQRVIAQKRAGGSRDGTVDLIWINGENFASGKKAGLWLEDWASDLPNARFLDPTDPSVTEDFQVPVDGQESPWTRASFVFATDSERVSEPPADLDALLEYARANPGRFTYPAPPDFTGSSFVRQVVAAMGEDEGFAFLAELRPFMYRAGEVLPKSEAELNELFANGKVDFAMSYDASFVQSEVSKGLFPESTRPFLLGGRSLTNASYVTIPADAADIAGAQIVANLLLSPDLQALKADPQILGHPTVLDHERLADAEQALFERASGSRYILSDLGTPLEELAAARVGQLEARWKREILAR